MALLIIVLGALLAGAGSFFIVLGFDIVMTDRGAAMTMAGTTALAGGIVTIGIGCAILRLTQLLRVAESRSGTEGGIYIPPEAPVAAGPYASEGSAPAATAAQPTTLGPGALVGAGATLAVATGMAAAGLAAGANQPGDPSQTPSPDATGLGETLLDPDRPNEAGSNLAARNGTTPDPEGPDLAVLDLDIPGSAAPDMEISASAISDRAAPAPDPEPASLTDFDAALMRALAEPPQYSPGAREPGTDNVLGFSGEWQEPLDAQEHPPEARIPGAFDDILDILKAPQGPQLHGQMNAPEKRTETLPEADSFTGTAPVDSLPPHPAGFHDRDIADVARQEAEDDSLARLPQVAPRDDGDMAADDHHRDENTDVAEPNATPIRTVLGKYNARGRVYTMFSDGSVEAVTESGVEMFASMQELREHLARA